MIRQKDVPHLRCPGYASAAFIKVVTSQKDKIIVKLNENNEAYTVHRVFFKKQKEYPELN